MPTPLLTLYHTFQTGYLDYDQLEQKALDFRPKLIISGGSAYPRDWDYKRLRQIADKVGSYLMTDMAHIRCDHTLHASFPPSNLFQKQMLTMYAKPLTCPLCRNHSLNAQRFIDHHTPILKLEISAQLLLQPFSSLSAESH